MKAYLPGIFAAGLGLLAGFLLARGSDGGPGEVRATASASAPVRPPRVPVSERLAEPQKVEHRLAALLTLDRRRLNRDETNRKLMAAGNAELKQLLAGLIGLDKSARSLAVTNLRNQVIREIYHREGPSSLEAAERLGDPRTLGEFINCLAHEDALAAAGWLERFKQVIRDRHPTLAGDDLASTERHELLPVLGQLFDSALSQGAEVAAALLERLGDSVDPGSIGGNSLPDDFDHGKLFEALDPREVLRVPGTTDLFESWAAHDRDSALALALRAAADAPPGSVDLTFSVFQGVCKLEGEESAAAWLSESLAPLPESERARILSRFFEHRHPPSPAAYRDVLAGLGNDADRIHFGATVLNPRLEVEQFVSYFDGIPSMDLRAGILEASSHKWAAMPRSEEQKASYRARFEALADAAGITGEARTRVMAPWP
jgi:hypothetical protein